MSAPAAANANGTITYTYDDLYRLTAADYSDGSYYHYTYDAVGNRLSETTPNQTTLYTYDSANRMTSAGGVSYTWDDNGNLVDDGISSYTYDDAGRLVQLTQGEVSYTYTYNGLGDRVQQNENGEVATYTLDMAAHLTKVLSDGEHTYLNGLGRIGETSTSGGWRYHLADALGSVRQLADSSVNILSTQSYKPYGEVLHSFGDYSSNYSFVGEWLDSNGLHYMRSRYYTQNLGIFTSRDPFDGYGYAPASLNGFNYAYGNPINIVDPGGDNPIAYCLGLILIDGPLPIGDAVCLAIYAGLGLLALVPIINQDIDWD